MTVAEGQEAKFTVKIAGGKPKPTIKWFKEEEEITTTIETYEVVEIEDTVTLIIKSAKPENAGNYYAQLLNEAGTISTNKAQLIVNSASFFYFELFYRMILHLINILKLKEARSLLKSLSLWLQSIKTNLFDSSALSKLTRNQLLAGNNQIKCLFYNRSRSSRKTKLSFLKTKQANKRKRADNKRRRSNRERRK